MCLSGEAKAKRVLNADCHRYEFDVATFYKDVRGIFAPVIQVVKGCAIEKARDKIFWARIAHSPQHLAH